MTYKNFFWKFLWYLGFKGGDRLEIKYGACVVIKNERGSGRESDWGESDGVVKEGFSRVVIMRREMNKGRE